MRRVQPFDHIRIAPSRHTGRHSGRIARFPRGIIVDQPHIIHPAVDDERHQQFQVQPGIEIVRGLAANVMYHLGFVQFGVQLAASVTGYCVCRGKDRLTNDNKSTAVSMV